MTLEELESLEAGTFELYDIRSETEISHGAIPGAIASSAAELLDNPPLNRGQRVVICCSRGRVSVEIAEELRERGYDAESLEGGYIAWLMREMKK